MRHPPLKRALLLTALLLALIFGMVQAANSVTLNGYTIDFLGATQNGSQSTWTYAVSVTGIPTNGLSHITFGLGTCAILVAPAGGTYTTPTTPTECGDGTYSCQSTTYTAVPGLDPTTGVDGIKFEDPADQLEDGVTVTHIFEITLDGVFAAIQQDQPVAIKTGNTSYLGQLTGASCGTPTAVTLTNAQADSPATAVPGPALLALLLLTGGAIVQRHRRGAE